MLPGKSGAWDLNLSPDGAHVYIIGTVKEAGGITATNVALPAHLHGLCHGSEVLAEDFGRELVISLAGVRVR